MATLELVDAELLCDEFTEEDVYDFELTPEEEEELDERIRESKAGLGIPHEIVRAEVREWLTAEQLEDFEIGRRQIAAGLAISHEDVMKKFDALYPDDE